MYIDSWVKKHTYDTFKEVLGSGMQCHLQVRAASCLSACPWGALVPGSLAPWGQVGIQNAFCVTRSSEFTCDGETNAVKVSRASVVCRPVETLPAPPLGCGSRVSQ